MSARRWPRALQQAGLQRNSPTVRLIVFGIADALCWVLAWLAAAAVIATLGDVPQIAELLALSILVQLAVGAGLALYRNRYLIGSRTELRALAIAVLVVLLANLVIGAVLHPAPPIAETVVAAGFALIAMSALRQLVRAGLDRSRRPRSGARVVLVGAGRIGQQLIEQMQRDPASEYLPVGLVDDDRAKRFLTVSGVPVRGDVAALRTVCAELGAAGVVVAIDRAEGELFRRLTAELEGTEVWIRTVPSLNEQLHRDLSIAQLRDVSVEDLIGRRVDPIDLSGAAELITGARILVTGAGGSIGAELCRQIHALEPAALIMLDRDESALHALSMTLYGRALMDAPELVLADVRDPAALTAVFTRHRPEIVFHAAALKHLPMLERFPAEAWKTNVHGTLNTLLAAEASGVSRFVNISTDKSANPTSELGRSKLMAERLTAAVAARTGRPYVSVRFGNVFGSRGSVLISFAEQIRTGGPVTITHPEVTRYFMTIPEACQLVLQAAALGSAGETLVLDMGEPVPIVDVARRMMAICGTRCPIAYTGLREGEKLHEELFTAAEEDTVQIRDRIWHVPAGSFPPEQLPGPQADPARIAACYRSLHGGQTGPSAGRDSAAEADASVADASVASLLEAETGRPALGSADLARPAALNTSIESEVHQL